MFAFIVYLLACWDSVFCVGLAGQLTGWLQTDPLPLPGPSVPGLLNNNNKNIFKFLCTWRLCLYVCLWRSEESLSQIPWDWSFIWLWATIWVLGSKLRFSERAASVFNPLSHPLSLWLRFLKFSASLYIFSVVEERASVILKRRSTLYRRWFFTFSQWPTIVYIWRVKMNLFSKTGVVVHFCNFSTQHAGGQTKDKKGKSWLSQIWRFLVPALGR